MSIVVTGAAGFIGSHVCQRLLARGDDVIGIDNMNSYYDPALKAARLARLSGRKAFSFHQLDIAEPGALAAALGKRPVRGIVHLAAQAGVRYSLENPRAYIHANIAGQLEILELCRASSGLEHLVYASSSSVYGGNTKVPFAESDRVDDPVSIYAATKKADELMSSTYAHLFGLPQTGLRFFTVYGPWGRPDMASWIFTEAMLAGKPIRVFNHGEMWRDFTYIDDIVEGVVAVLDKPPASDGPRHRLYNIGNSQPVHLGRFIDTLESLLGVKAIRDNLPLQPGEVEKTYADTSALERDFGFRPKVRIEEGLRKFVDWYRQEWRPEGKR
ncbi:NAD-dependent epimerase/dehydratase family protein [Mesorhizobium sp. M4B.F.Ca.ET.215.01.1.1]|uniref:NAD-dependent epimerase/dehydratase family protein n=2 Tax=Phyllobacteriaceae TaxID=69277 RepID=UPI000FCB702C|nr:MULTISPECIES: NAD-dependent epimerase/dehydratase family protein [unclassified Mesorhizobium]RVC59385.1 NAD-dependent epimerase/dehydratase family protein [Mesorhizobium sp. M4B.F.Ca.ET.088.02.2.1]RUW25263.1 NAD-dependent epimerase/dehydratase family protein [Mesorhizobium sp. M4B.F.Ca.ET.013.02.1.1]RUW76675.1 NAD-dependent epimerase/dehydratase family protein [Mesorhizobium sp. M4B.F.Ca.ET.049.02.1.2]RVD39350.1 NAD-dependent epimerase/dehydratase family protein [Mesorhizobium sp. M4B.F.Ca.E